MIQPGNVPVLNIDPCILIPESVISAATTFPLTADRYFLIEDILGRSCTINSHTDGCVEEGCKSPAAPQP